MIRTWESKDHMKEHSNINSWYLGPNSRMFEKEEEDQCGKSMVAHDV